MAATAGIAAFARGRGGKPWLWGTLTVVGYFVVPFLVRFLALKLGANPLDLGENGQLWFFISALSCVAVIAFCARFLLGRGYQKPSGMWSLCKLQIFEQAVRGDLRGVSAALRQIRTISLTCWPRGCPFAQAVFLLAL